MNWYIVHVPRRMETKTRELQQLLVNKKKFFWASICYQVVCVSSFLHQPSQIIMVVNFWIPCVCASYVRSLVAYDIFVFTVELSSLIKWLPSSLIKWNRVHLCSCRKKKNWNERKLVRFLSKISVARINKVVLLIPFW